MFYFFEIFDKAREVQQSKGLRALVFYGMQIYQLQSLALKKNIGLTKRKRRMSMNFDYEGINVMVEID